MTKQDKTSFELTKGHLPSSKKVFYSWETKHSFQWEPWHLTTLALVLDLFIMLMYLYMHLEHTLQLKISYGVLIFNSCILVGSIWWLKSKPWGIGVRRFGALLNTVTCCITLVLVLFTFLLSLAY